MKGSAGQAVIQPTLAEARFQRSLLATLLGKLGLPENDEDDELAAQRGRRSAAGRKAAKARWNRGY